MKILAAGRAFSLQNLPFALSVSPPQYAVAVVYYSLGGPNWPYRDWLNGKRDECRYPGVVCNGKGHVRTLSLVSGGLTGQIPHEIHELTDLQVLDLSDNDIGGIVPDSIGEMKKLGEFNVILMLFMCGSVRAL